MLPRAAQETPQEAPAEVSPGGSRIYKHEEPESRVFQLPKEYGRYGEEVCAHFDKLFPGRETGVFHEIMSDLVHIDVYIMKPTEDDDFHVIYTTGMSDLPMTLPADLPEAEKWSHAELFMLLPGSWNSAEALAVSSEIPHEDYWPINLIKFLARLPHEYKTWLCAGHTIPNGPNYEPVLPGSHMGGAVIMGTDEKYSPIIAADNTALNLFMVMPASRAEIEYKLDFGMEALYEMFDKFSVPMVVDVFRKSCI